MNELLGTRFLTLVVVIGLAVYVFQVLRGDSRTEAAVTTGVDESASGSVQGIPVVDHEPAESEVVTRRDPIKNLVGVILERDLAYLEEVAIGRYLRDAREGIASPIPKDISVEAMRCVRRGKGWLLVEAPFETPDLWSQTAIPRGRVRLRFVQSGKRWKLEHIKVLEGGRK